MSHSRLIALPALLLALTLSACGSDGDGSGGVAMSPVPAEPAATTTDAGSGSADASGVLQGTLPRLNGEPQDLAAYRGRVVLVVTRPQSAASRRSSGASSGSTATAEAKGS